MSTKNMPTPSRRELAILSIIWREGSATVSEVHSETGPVTGTRYTTTLKQMQVMYERGILSRDKRMRGKAHVYRARMKKEPTQRRVLHDLVDLAFSGSVKELMKVAGSLK